MKYKFLEHTADVKFQAFGETIEEAFENSAIAMFEVLHRGKVKNKKKVKISVNGRDFESLLYNFLEEFLVLFDSESFFISKIEKIKIDKKKFRLEAEVSGDNSKNYQMNSYIKAVTYNEMFVKNEKGKWVIQVVLDV